MYAYDYIIISGNERVIYVPLYINHSMHSAVFSGLCALCLPFILYLLNSIFNFTTFCFYLARLKDFYELPVGL